MYKKLFLSLILLIPLMQGCIRKTYKRVGSEVVIQEEEVAEQSITQKGGESMFKSIHTLAIYVSDMERAKRFYTEILGFDVRVDLGPTLCFLISKSGNINIYLEAGHKPNPVDMDDTHLSFFLSTEKSTQETFDELKAKGVTILDEEPEEVGDGVFVFRFLDPDGNILEATGH